MVKLNKGDEIVATDFAYILPMEIVYAADHQSVTLFLNDQFYVVYFPFQRRRLNNTPGTWVEKEILLM